MTVLGMQSSLNAYLELGKTVWVAVRQLLQAALSSYDPAGSTDTQHGVVHLLPQVCCTCPLANLVRDCAGSRLAVGALCNR